MNKYIEVNELVLNYPKHYSRILQTTQNKLLQDIQKNVSFLNEYFNSVNIPLKISTQVFYFLNGYHDILRCKECNKPIIKNIGVNHKPYYFCSVKCMANNEDIFKQKEQTSLIKYGVHNPSQSQLIKDKVKKSFNTDKRKNASIHRKQKCLELYGVEYSFQAESVKRKIRKSVKETTGYECALASPICRNKGKKTKLVKYGDENYFNIEKFTQTCLKNHGVAYPMQNNEIRKKAASKYIYDNLEFDSAPELAFYIWLKDNKFEFEYQPNQKFEYYVNNKLHFYFPDFKIGSTFYEIKGDQFFKNHDINSEMICPWNHQLDYLYEAKHQCMLNNNVKILTSKDYQKYLDYVNLKYNKLYLKQFKRKTK